MWSGGKGGDNFKALPITIEGGRAVPAGTFLLCVAGGKTVKAEFCLGAETDGRGGSHGKGQAFHAGHKDEVSGGDKPLEG